MVKHVRALLFVIFMVGIFVTLSWATPPTNLTLTYDLETKTLHIEMTHVSSHLRKHYIRKILVYKNDQEVEDIRLVSQTTPSSVIRDVVLDAKDKDVIRVKAICSEAGTAEASLTVQEKTEEK